MRALRTLGGVMAAGMVVLALVVVGAAIVGARRGFPGPGGASVAWHVGAAIFVVLVQWRVDRGRGPLVYGGVAAILVAVGLVLVTQWWN